MPVGLAEKVAYLRRLCGPGDEVIETHFAWVFLIGERAFKLRKPVRRDTMDYGTLAARKADSEAEVRLNRRLARDVYLRTVPLNLDADGALALDGPGVTVDWLVEMRRLDRRAMLDAALEHGEVPPRELDAVIELLADFYATEVPAIVPPGALAPRLRGRAEANHAVLCTLDAIRAGALLESQLIALERLGPELGERVAQGCVVEAHGDLRPEHIHLAAPPAVIDCLEFDRELRIMDRAEELCFLELECTRLGRPVTGRYLLEACLRRLSDAASPGLLDFYRSHRAATRAKLYLWRAAEPDGDTPEHWRMLVGQYLERAEGCLRR